MDNNGVISIPLFPKFEYLVDPLNRELELCQQIDDNNNNNNIRVMDQVHLLE